jgi:hypothetical protein
MIARATMAEIDPVRMSVGSRQLFSWWFTFTRQTEFQRVHHLTGLTLVRFLGTDEDAAPSSTTSATGPGSS